MELPGPQIPRQEHTRTYFLSKLAGEVEARGLGASLTPHPPSLRVTDPRTGLLSETVDCVAMSDEQGRAAWFYRWSWGDLVDRAEHPAAAADKIRHVFGPD